MTWQDIVLSVGSWIFIIAVLPILTAKEKPPLFTNFLNGIVLLVFTFVYFTLHLRVSMVSTGILGIVWLVFGIQKILQNNTPKGNV